MMWVKRGGGTGTGSYGKGLAAATLAHDHPEKPRPAHPTSSTGPEAVQTAAAERPAPTAYTATQWTEILGNRVMLELLAQCVINGEEPQMSIYYEDALTTFGADSVHFTAACHGQTWAGTHYQRTVANGQFHTL